MTIRRMIEVFLVKAFCLTLGMAVLVPMAWACEAWYLLRAAAHGASMRVAGGMFCGAASVVCALSWWSLRWVLWIDWIRTASTVIVVGVIAGTIVPVLLVGVGLIALAPRD